MEMMIALAIIALYASIVAYRISHRGHREKHAH